MAMFNRFADWLIARTRRILPDVVIGADIQPTYLRRWWIIPRNRVFNIYLHQFRRSDDDRALHDHPWLFNCSVILRGWYSEHRILDGGIHEHRAYGAGDILPRFGAYPHRLELPCCESDGVWTLFVTGPVVRSWGFHCARGWVPWQEFTRADNPGEIGKGCE